MNSFCKTRLFCVKNRIEVDSFLQANVSFSHMVTSKRRCAVFVEDDFKFIHEYSPDSRWCFHPTGQLQVHTSNIRSLAEDSRLWRSASLYRLPQWTQDWNRLCKLRPFEGSTCHVLNTHCKAENSMAIVEGDCEDQNSCLLEATNAKFGNDPCFLTSKYLEVSDVELIYFVL